MVRFRTRLRWWWGEYNFPIIMLGLLGAVVFAAMFISRSISATRERDCTAVCSSRGHERFPVEGGACFCAGPEGAYSPGATEPPRSGSSVVPVVVPVRVK